jgi:hypothetical protein
MGMGTDASSVDLMTCSTIWLPVGCEFQAGMDGRASVPCYNLRSCRKL